MAHPFYVRPLRHRCYQASNLNQGVHVSILWIVSAIIAGFSFGFLTLVMATKVGHSAGASTFLGSALLGFAVYFIPGPFIAQMLWHIPPDPSAFLLFAVSWIIGFAYWIALSITRGTREHHRKLRRLSRG